MPSTNTVKPEHRALVELVHDTARTQGINVAAQLIADSEARAVEASWQKGWVAGQADERKLRLAENKADHDTIITLRADLIAARADVERMRSLLEQMLNVAENADETGYVTDCGFVDLDKLHANVRAAIDAAKEDK